MRVIRLLVIPVLALSGLLVACSNDELPTKSEFIADIKKETGKSFDDSMKSAGIDSATASKIFDSFAGCVYDKIADNEELLRSISNAKGKDSTELQKALESKAKSCVDDFQSEITKQVAGG